MVSLPDTVRKTAAIDEDRSGADQVVEPSGTGGSEQSKPLTVVKNMAAVGFGIVGIVIVLFTLLLCAMELTRGVPAVACGTQTAQNVDRGACAAVAEADVQADFPLGN